MRRHNRALYTITQQHMAVSQLAASGRPINRSPVFPSITHARLTCYMALTATWLASSPCNDRHAITIAHLSTAQRHSWFCCHVFPASTCAGCWPTRPPPMPHPNTPCSWRGTEWCLLPKPFGTSHNGCMLHAWAMLRVLPSKAGCVRNMLWAGYALCMVVAWQRPTDCKSSHAPFSRH
jgi:hypothetical protein